MTSQSTSPEAPARRSADEFQERVREALIPLLADETLLEKTTLKIRKYMNCTWKHSETSPFFDFEEKVNHVVSHFAPDGLTRESYLRAAVRRTSLFFQNPETLIGNIEQVVDHFRHDGLTRRDYLRGAVKQPQLFYQKPETLIRNIERVAHHFRQDGLTREKYLRAAGNQPSLFFRKPETIISHVDLITGLYRQGLLNLQQSPDLPPGAAARVIQYMVRNPALFLMSDDNIALRETYARVTDTRPSAKILMRSSRRAIEDRLAEEVAQTVKLPAHSSKSKPIDPARGRPRVPVSARCLMHDRR